MAGKKTGKRLLTWVLVLVMALSLLPLNALAANRPETDSSSGMNFTKELLPNQPDDDGNYTSDDRAGNGHDHDQGRADGYRAGAGPVRLDGR